jgi:2-dehydro-3-deoxyphosphogluconate aldolase/(4S)-4-hydroxy-2-oxoglutarate aldolase
VNAHELMDLCPVVPVVVIPEPEQAVPLARALVAGGVSVIEVTLRTPSALESIRRIAAEVPEAHVGAGTVVTAAQAAEAAAAGASFLISPGSTPALREAMAATGLPYLPGVATASEAMTLLEHGITAMKFFPAESAGGVAHLKSLYGPLPQLRFCPTGGITPQTAASYLALPNVACVGGSWLTPVSLVTAGDWATVTGLAKETAALGRS